MKASKVAGKDLMLNLLFAALSTTWWLIAVVK